MVVRMMTWPQYQEFLFTSELRQVAKFIKKTDAYLTKEWEELQERIAEECDSMDEEDAHMTWSSYGDEFFDLNIDFPVLHAGMTFVSLWSLLEHHLITLCRRRQRECSLTESVDDHHGIDAAKRYLKKVCGLKFPADTTEWSRIRDHQSVRNVIVHRRGELKKGDDKEVREFIGNSKTAKIKLDTVVLSYDFCLEFINILETFAKQVTASIPTTKTPRQLYVRKSEGKLKVKRAAKRTTS